MKQHGSISRWNLIAVFALAVGGAACMTGEASTEQSARSGDTDPGTGGGSCAEILDSCDATVLAEKGITVEQCRAALEPAYDECVRSQACRELADEAAARCAPKDETCYEEAEQVFRSCYGPLPPQPTPGK